MTDCIPAIIESAAAAKRAGKNVGDYCAPCTGKLKARQALIKREGPPPFQGAICRHLCENDSMARNGFVCTLHTTWGTSSENEIDKSPEMRAKGGKLGGKIVGKIFANRPTQPQKLQVTCHHCGKIGQYRVMMRWHFHNCKAAPSPENDRAARLVKTSEVFVNPNFSEASSRSA